MWQCVAKWWSRAAPVGFWPSPGPRHRGSVRSVGSSVARGAAGARPRATGRSTGRLGAEPANDLGEPELPGRDRPPPRRPPTTAPPARHRAAPRRAPQRRAEARDDRHPRQGILHRNRATRPRRFRAIPEATHTRESLEHNPPGAAGRSPETWMTDSRPIHSVVLVKQVPDTHNLTGEVMTKDGTMNRNALPAIFNPEDLNALEMALEIKGRHGGTVTVITMGPPKATNILREALFRGADKVVLLTDRKFAGADTLATSVALQWRSRSSTASTCSVRPPGHRRRHRPGGPADGREARHPADHLRRVRSSSSPRPRSRRSAPSTPVRRSCAARSPACSPWSARPTRPAPPRSAARWSASSPPPPASTPPSAPQWPEFETDEALEAYLAEHDLKIPVWTAEDIGATEGSIGLAGSPTQVHKINFVVLESTESKTISAHARRHRGDDRRAGP